MDWSEINWFEEIPDGSVETSTYHGEYFWEIRGRSGRWCVVRRHIFTGNAVRTKYHPNLASAGQLFEELIAA